MKHDYVCIYLCAWKNVAGKANKFLLMTFSCLCYFDMK